MRWLDGELAEMMVEMFVHQLGPLVGGHGAKEGVGMSGAALRATAREAVDQCAKALGFCGEVAFIGDDQGFGSGHVALQGGFVAKHSGPGDRPEDAAEEHARRKAVANGPFHGGGAMCQGLGGRHGAPLAGAGWPETRDALLNLGGGGGIKQILHSEPLAFVGAPKRITEMGEPLQWVRSLSG